MPLFEYRCTRCEHEFEALVRDAAWPECPACGATKPDKLLSAVAARVSGSRSLPVSAACPPSDAPPCGPGCCRLR
jgi:putative FmdB family regulatory protein